MARFIAISAAPLVSEDHIERKIAHLEELLAQRLISKDIERRSQLSTCALLRPQAE